MSNLTTEEKIYLVECFFSRGKVYSNAYRGFRTKYGTHKVKSENTLKRLEFIISLNVCVTSLHFLAINLNHVKFKNYQKWDTLYIQLVLRKCVTRLLDNWEVLKHYFHLENIENKNNSAITIFNILNDNKIKAYMLFLKYSLHFFNEFNALFQGRKVLIYKLSESSEHFIKQIGCNFLLPAALKNLSLEIINPQYFLDVNLIYTGPECESFLQLESSKIVLEIKSTCLSFYTTALEEMLQRLPYNDKILRQCKFLDSSVALREESRLNFPDLKDIAKHFQISDITALAHE
ncbi:hypothetical protein X777_04184 [Ooceraea biroi]|uniref:DUF4817 domain-containing protein n=1 Tax=Ooceraea biroi TaxID=2015173 RepID=A0A026WI39_OOCBI|nr:hypothetical protein X777_04184 [Ooceraea biroi]